MKTINMNPSNNYHKLISKISVTYTEGKEKAAAAVNQHITETYWKVGEHIVEFEQDGKQRAEYGSGLLERLSKDLSILHSKGFSVSNIQRMRHLYDEYPIYATLSHKLSWSHYVELFQTTKQNISLHIKNIFEEGELQENSTVKDYLTVQTEGKGEVQRF